MQAQKDKIKAGEICYKCKLNKPNFTNKADKVCKDCFIGNTILKFLIFE